MKWVLNYWRQERMSQGFLNCDAPLWVVGQKARKQVLCIRREVLRDIICPMLDLLESLLDLRAFKGRTSYKHHIEDATDGPDVTLKPEPLAIECLWGDVIWRPANC